MIYDKLKRKGLKRSLLLFKEWFQDKHHNSGRFYKWYVFLHEWTDEFQMIELHNFLLESNNSFITYKMINENLYKGMINKKVLPTSFKDKTEAMLHCVIGEFKKLEYSLKNSEESDSLEENRNIKNIKSRKEQNKERIQKEKEKREKIEEMLKDKKDKIRDKESFEDIQDFNPNK